MVTPRENQHSDLLAWCFNAREGHGQGDSLFKDFLLEVYRRSTSDEPGDLIHGKGLTRDFVKTWTPARILTTSFATAFTLREYSLQVEASERAGNRLDLLVIDPENKLLVVLENKAGARFRRGQLANYLSGVQDALLSRPAFSQFHVAFVAIDRNCDPEADPDDDENFDRRWARLDYEWLRPGAGRAEVAVRRGNQGAALLLSYCRAQTGHQSDQERLASINARNLAIEFPLVIQELKKVASELKRPESWTPSLLRHDAIEGQLLRLYMQYREAVERVIAVPPLMLLDGKLSEHFPILKENPELRESGRVWMNYRLPTDIALPMEGVEWPLSLRIRHINRDSDGKPKFRIRLLWRPKTIPEDDRSRVCDALGNR